MFNTLSTIQEVSIMSSKVGKSIKRSFRQGPATALQGIGAKVLQSKSVRGKLEEPFRTGKSRGIREAKQATLLQTQREKARVAEAEDEVARRRGGASSGKSGRQSLIKSRSASGLATTLGG